MGGKRNETASVTVIGGNGWRISTVGARRHIGIGSSMIARSDHTSAELVNRTKQIVTRLGDQKNTKNGHRARRSAQRAKRALRVIEAVKGTAGRWR